jgi:hypothetical protein
MEVLVTWKLEENLMESETKMFLLYINEFLGYVEAITQICS